MVRPSRARPSYLLASLAGQKRDALPDVIFLLETLPSPIVQTLVEKKATGSSRSRSPTPSP